MTSLNSVITGTKAHVNALVTRVLESTIVSKFSKLISEFLSLLSVNAPDKVVSLISTVLVLAVGKVMISQIIALVKLVGSKLGLAIGADVSSEVTGSSVESVESGSESEPCVAKHKCDSSSSPCSDSSCGVNCANGCGKKKCANGCGYEKCANGCGSCSS
jgi:hypothetical protein